jgi:hypothetical protein
MLYYIIYIWYQYTTVSIFKGKTTIFRHLLKVAEFFWNLPNFGEEVAEKLWKDLATGIVPVSCSYEIKVKPSKQFYAAIQMSKRRKGLCV